VSTGLLIVAMLSHAAVAADEDPGYLELRGAWLAGVGGQRGQLVEELRPSFTSPLGEHFKLSATVDLSLSEGRDTPGELDRLLEDGGFGPLLASQGCAVAPATSSLFHVNRASDYLEVARLHLDYYSEHLDVRAGRQAVHWGSAQFFNPTDPFPEVMLTEPWRPRRGVNAVRAHYGVGIALDADLVAAVDDSLTKGRAAARLRVNRWGVDAALSAGWRGGDRWLVGLDLRGTFGVGYWLEAALVPTRGVVHEELALGLDYSFDLFERLVVMAEYYRIGANPTSPDAYQRIGRLAAAAGTTCSFLSGSGVDPFASPMLARDYFLASVTAAFTPDVTATLPYLQNLDDGTAVILPTLTWGATGWLDVSLSAQLPFLAWGRGGELKPRPGDLVVVAPVGGATARADLAELVPAATFTLWTRASF
jgi:hypothetical protein